MAHVLPIENKTDRLFLNLVRLEAMSGCFSGNKGHNIGVGVFVGHDFDRTKKFLYLNMIDYLKVLAYRDCGGM